MTGVLVIVVDIAGYVTPWLFDSREEFDKALAFAQRDPEVRVRYITENGEEAEPVTDAHEMETWIKEQSL